MTTLIIPDIHTKHSRAEAIIQSVDHSHVILLGDYFDDWNDSAEQNRATAEWLKEKLHDPTVTCLWGNHDQHYLLDDRRWICSGYDPLKKLAIRSILKDEDIRLLDLAALEQDYLLSHAGFDERLVGCVFPVEDLVLYANTKALHSMREGARPNSLLGIGQVRGGPNRIGGITWQDWDELRPGPYKQVVGHTRGKEPRWEDDSVCIDTNLGHYALITNGMLTVHAVEEL